MSATQSQKYNLLKKHFIKLLTFWIFPRLIRRYFARRLRYYFGIGAKPEMLSEYLSYNKAIKQSLKKHAGQNLFSYRIISLGSDCFSRTVPTLWGIKPRKAQGEVSYPFDLSTNVLSGIVKNLDEDFAHYFDTLCFNGRFWELPGSQTVFSHEYDCAKQDEKRIRERFIRRINNLRQAFKDEKPTLFIQHFVKGLNDCSPTQTAELYNRLYQTLSERRRKRPFKLLIVDYYRYIPATQLHPEMVLLAPDYLPDNYVWNYPEFKFRQSGLKFEKEFIGIIAELVAEMK